MTQLSGWLAEVTSRNLLLIASMGKQPVICKIPFSSTTFSTGLGVITYLIVSPFSFFFLKNTIVKKEEEEKNKEREQKSYF
jgi:cytochrome bd-type quinol oxidase subunit 1